MIVAIVEGHGDAEAVPTLLRRLLAEREVWRDIKSFRVKRQKVVKPGELERALAVAILDSDCEGVLVVIDADEDCPAVLGPALAIRAQEAVGHIPVGIVLANTEFEAWLIAGLAGLRGQRGIDDDARVDREPDTLASPKGVLDRLMRDRSYLETDDQAAFAARIDLDAARRASRSFRKLQKELERVVPVSQ